MRGITRLALGLAVNLAACAQDTPADVLLLEAEDAELSGTEVDTAVEGYSGTGYVTGFEDATDKVTFSFEVAEEKLYDLNIRYAGIYGEKQTSVTLNGGVSFEVPLEETEAFETASGGQVLLSEGDNTIEIISNWGW